MARTIQTRKRSGGPIRRNVKRRRTRRRSGRKSTSFTSQAGTGGGLRFSARRVSRRRYRSMLWNASQLQTHWRSNHSSTITVLTPGTADTMTVGITPARNFGNGFWTTLGGGVNPDGGGMSAFVANGDLTIRGGMMGMRVSNIPDAADVDKDALQCTVFLLRTSVNFNSGVIPSTVRQGWDPTLVADFKQNVGHIVLRKTFLLAEGEVGTVERKMPVQRIDQSEYLLSHNEYIWLFVCSNTSAISAKSLRLVPYYNLSFVGDAV